MGSDAVIGEQLHQGNKWTGGGITLAQHLGGANLSLKSKFIVDANESPSYLPNLVNPPGWFDNVSTPTSSFQCNPGGTDCPIVQYGADPVLEREIAKSQLTGLSYQAPQLWTAQRRLYERLTEEGNPYYGDVDFNNFLTQSQTNGLKAYADLQIGMRQILQTSVANRNDLATSETQIGQSLDQLAIIEVQLDALGLSQQDSIALAAQRNSIKQSLVSFSTQRENKLNTIASTSISLASALNSQNNSLTGTGDYRTNEKTVNSIYLQTIAIGNNTFSDTQLSSLQAIAAQCPLFGGEAVLRARDMLALVQDAPTHYNNANTCGNAVRPSQNRIEQLQVNDFVQVRPNPASENIVVDYSLSEGVKYQIMLVSIFGQVVGIFPLDGHEGVTTIPINKLPEGIYWYSVTGGIGKSSPGKLIIHR